MGLSVSPRRNAVSALQVKDNRARHAGRLSLSHRFAGQSLWGSDTVMKLNSHTVTFIVGGRRCYFKAFGAFDLPYEMIDLIAGRGVIGGVVVITDTKENSAKKANIRGRL